MDNLEHIDELQEMIGQEVAHEGDSALYVRLAMRALEIRALCRRLLAKPQAGDEETINMLIIDEMTVYQSMVDVRKITRDQKDRLFLLMTQDTKAA